MPKTIAQPPKKSRSPRSKALPPQQASGPSIESLQALVHEQGAKLQALDKVQAVIEFALDGTILRANDNFLQVMGYSLADIQGKPHRMFVEPSYAHSAEYAQFWERLRSGQFQSAEYKRIAKGGREVWILASYNPLFDQQGKPYKIVKYAKDVTHHKLRNVDVEGQIAAIGKAQAVIEFSMDGKVLSANENFLRALGYTQADIVGKHHQMFVTPEYARSEAYRRFWEKLREGQHDAGEYKRVGAGGREVWIQASYNPILNLEGRPFKIVKYAYVITQQKQAYLELSRVIDALSRGDLTVEMTGTFEGDHAALRDKMNSTIEALASLVSQISDSVGAIRSGAADIAEGNGNLNTRTQDQALSLQSTAASVEQLTATVKQNAGHATQANQLATSARGAAEKGGQVVATAVSAMGAITEASKKVSDIISVIEQIAFQTNMLALNAAVEAARAGDQGRGFAVVAAEVRTLAQRSASAAKEIKALIQDSQEKVEHGAKLVNHSGVTLQEIVGSVQKVSSIIGEIDDASEQQSAGIHQINDAVAQIDKHTQQNAALVEEATAAAASMSEQARAMAELVEFFTVKKADQNAPARVVQRGQRPANQQHTPARLAQHRR
ncbi:MAG: hypothetical protein RL701_2270 [Pseudomonadota bacterium]